MNKHKENSQDKKLKHLLDQKNDPDAGAMDEFEKEAMEGFDLLDSREEAFELKHRLDQRIQKVFEKAKKKNNFYWYAAAGLILIIGFSVYFLRMSPLSKQEELAVTTSVPHEAKKMQVQDLPKTESKPLQNTGTIQKENTTRTFAPKEENSKARADRKVQMQAPEKANVHNNAKADVIDENKDLDVAATAPFSAAREVMQIPATPQVAEPGKNVAAEEITTGDTLAKSKSLAYSQPAKSDYGSDAEHKKNRSAKYERSSKVAPSSAPAAGAGGAGPATQIYYTGGNAQLNKDLKKSLSEAGVLMRFDAVLHVDGNGKVEKVDLTPLDKLNKEQQERMVTVLKKLNKFNRSGNAEPVEFRFSFRP